MSDNMKDVPGGKLGFIIFNIILIGAVMYGCSSSPKKTMADIAGTYHYGSAAYGKIVEDESTVVVLSKNGTGVEKNEDNNRSFQWKIVSPEKENGDLAIIEISAFRMKETMKVKDNILIVQ